VGEQEGRPVTTTIEWTDVTWNPTRGCSRVSEGCRNCYAERMAARYSGLGQAFEGFAKSTPAGPRWTGRVELVPSKLDEPLHWRKPRRVFVNSMSDLFHDTIGREELFAVWDVMRRCPQHTFQVLTKRAAGMREVFDWALSDSPLANVWLGVSVEDEATADERIPLLLQTPAAVRFVSYEPALASVDLRAYLAKPVFCDPYHGQRLDWVIVGGESGPGARPFDLAWARFILRQCREAGVPCFVKQLGARPHDAPTSFQSWRALDRNGVERDGRFWPALESAKGGDPSEWPEDLRVREFPTMRIAAEMATAGGPR
jgi:protein gp37